MTKNESILWRYQEYFCLNFNYLIFTNILGTKLSTFVRISKSKRRFSILKKYILILDKFIYQKLIFL